MYHYDINILSFIKDKVKSWFNYTCNKSIDHMENFDL